MMSDDQFVGLSSSSPRPKGGSDYLLPIALAGVFTFILVLLILNIFIMIVYKVLCEKKRSGATASEQSKKTTATTDIDQEQFESPAKEPEEISTEENVSYKVHGQQSVPITAESTSGATSSRQQTFMSDNPAYGSI